MITLELDYKKKAVSIVKEFLTKEADKFERGSKSKAGSYSVRVIDGKKVLFVNVEGPMAAGLLRRELQKLNE